MTKTSDTRSRRQDPGALRAPGPIVDMLGIPVSVETRVEEVVAWTAGALGGRGGLVTFVNPTAWATARTDPAYADNLREFDLVLSDGIGVVVAARALGLPPVERISFDSTSVAPAVFRLCAEQGIPVALIGGAPGVADRAAEVIRSETGLRSICLVRDGYFDSIDAISGEVARSGARIVICGMGVPRQEQVLIDLRRRGWSGVGFTCGGYLDQLSGGMRYYPEWIDRLHLRFVYRIYKEPRRLGKRFLKQYPVFAAMVLRGIIARKGSAGR